MIKKILGAPLLIFVFGVLVRLLWLGDMPGGLNQDEASIGYDAWALLHSGIDRNGMSWPVNFIAWGSGQNVLYGYLSMPFIALFGLTAFSVRLASALGGLLCLWLFWKLGKQEDKQLGIWALLLVATSPWQIMASRWGLESNIVPVVVLVAVYYFALSPLHIQRYIPIASIITTLAIYAYGPAYLFAPLFLLCAWVLIYKSHPIPLKTLAISVLGCFILALPMMLFIANNAVGTGNLHIGPITIPHYPSEARYSNIFLPLAAGGWQRIPDNSILVLQMLLGGQDDGQAWNAIPAWGPQYLLLTPFLLLGAARSLSKASSLTDRLMLAWLLTALITAFCTEANINRVNLIWLPSLWLAARGLWLLAGAPLAHRLAKVSIMGMGLAFSVHYFTNWQKLISEHFFPGFGQAIQRIVEIAPPKAPIAITSLANMPYVFTLFYTQTPPKEYLATASIPDRSAPFQWISHFGRFSFGFTAYDLPLQNYWVANKQELGAFTSHEFIIETSGNYSAISRRPAEQMECTQALDPNSLQGSQDFGSLGIHGATGMPNTGFVISGQYFNEGFGIHGTSQWSVVLPEPAQSLEVGLGISDSQSCSEGITFKVLSDGKTLYNSGRIQPGDLRFVRIPLNDAKTLNFQTDAGAQNRCDHGNWVRPLVVSCKKH